METPLPLPAILFEVAAVLNLTSPADGMLTPQQPSQMFAITVNACIVPRVESIIMYWGDLSPAFLKAT